MPPDDSNAAAKVAPVVAQWQRAAQVFTSCRVERAVELAERALATARQALPGDSLVVAWISGGLLIFRLSMNPPDATSTVAGRAARMSSIWERDERLVALSRNKIATCCARLEAGSLRTLTPEEHAFFSAVQPDTLPLESRGEEMLLTITMEALAYWPRGVADAEFPLLCVALRGALEAALSFEAQGELNTREQHERGPLIDVVSVVIGEILGVRSTLGRRLQEALRTSGALTPQTEAALLQLLARLLQKLELELPQSRGEVLAHLAKNQQTAAADVARHGLRNCTLPACGATEPHPRFFKCCSRCRSVVYCCAEHQKEDWPRHKRTDKCTKPAT